MEHLSYLQYVENVNVKICRSKVFVAVAAGEANDGC